MDRAPAPAAAFLPRSFALALALALGQAIIVLFAHGQVVADPGAPGNQRPTVLQAPNGVPLVNIQTPSAAGVSRNTYKQFDVDQQGAILNNPRANTQTELGGWVQGNPWLARGAARVILNEVNSSNPSQLRGYVEVAGNRAQLIIANPAGISCDGCGFINADRATSPLASPSSMAARWRATGCRAAPSRSRARAWTPGANYTDLIARSVEVNAGIWARQLQVTAGGNEVSVDHARCKRPPPAATRRPSRWMWARWAACTARRSCWSAPSTAWACATPAPSARRPAS